MSINVQFFIETDGILVNYALNIQECVPLELNRYKKVFGMSNC